jgi:hypothetical protein
MAGDKHRVSAHSNKGQKMTGKNRYKLPAGLLKRNILPERSLLEPLDCWRIKGDIPIEIF